MWWRKRHVAEPVAGSSADTDSNANPDTDSNANSDAGRWNDVYDHVNRRFAAIADGPAGFTRHLHQ